jgi:hypothetical protein
MLLKAFVKSKLVGSLNVKLQIARLLEKYLKTVCKRKKLQCLGRMVQLFHIELF